MDHHHRPAHDLLSRERSQDGRGGSATGPRVGNPRIVTSQSLFLGDQEIGIEHHGALYRLKITRQGKLILNK